MKLNAPNWEEQMRMFVADACAAVSEEDVEVIVGQMILYMGELLGEVDDEFYSSEKLNLDRTNY